MKRHPGLRRLSRDHQHGLVEARRLRHAGSAAAAGSAMTPARAFLQAWVTEIRPHFQMEEEVLLPAYARYGDPHQPPIVRMLVEHVEIRRRVDDLAREVNSGSPDLATMTALGALLYSHIRYEEEVVFPLVEAALPEPALAALATRLAVAAGDADPHGPAAPG